MVKPLGGRGKKAPYESVMVRCPLPIKTEVEALIARYRAIILEGGESTQPNTDEVNYLSDIFTSIKLVDEFVEEIGQTEHLHSKTRRDNKNLARFRDWLASKTN